MTNRRAENLRHAYLQWDHAETRGETARAERRLKLLAFEIADDPRSVDHREEVLANMLDVFPSSLGSEFTHRLVVRLESALERLEASRTGVNVEDGSARTAPRP